ncbi:hypothetical protein [Methylobacterium sp. A54F]
MATKTIRANVTLHVPADGHKPFSIDPASGAVTGGKYLVKAVPPGTPVELDEAEANALIEAKVAEIYEEPKPVATKVDAKA